MANFKSFGLGALALAALTLAPLTASAFCRTWSCDPDPKKNPKGCPVDPENPQCPVGGRVGEDWPLYWPQPCVGFSLNENASRQLWDEKKGETIEQGRARFAKIANQAFAAWQKVSCPASGAHPAGSPTIQFANLGFASCGMHEYNQNKESQDGVAQGNANLIVFREDKWPYEGAANTLALTTLTFNTNTGEIYDADMEINAVAGKVRLTTSDTDVDTDLLSVMTHEAGHFIGIAHSPDTTATMYAIYSPKSTEMRSLEADDKAAICAIYPPDRANLPACDPTPRHGYSSACGEPTDPPTTPKGCSTSGSGSGAGGAGAGALALAMAALLGARRRGGKKG